jgi:hypothetical protein
MNKHYRNDDDAFDERGLLRDGRVYRAKLTMMDHDPTHRRRIVDASGDALGLHRPGYRVFDVDDVGDVKAEARRRYEQELCDSWRGDAASNPTKDPDLNDPDDDEDDDERPRRRRRFQERDPFGRESGSISEEDGDRYQVRCADNDAAVRPRRSADLAMHRPGFRVPRHRTRCSMPTTPMRTCSRRRGGVARERRTSCRTLRRPQATMRRPSTISRPHIGSTPKKFHRHGRGRDKRRPVMLVF